MGDRVPRWPGTPLRAWERRVNRPRARNRWCRGRKRHPPSTVTWAPPRRERHRSPARSRRTRPPRRARALRPGRRRPPATSRSGTDSRPRRPPAEASHRMRLPPKRSRPGTKRHRPKPAHRRCRKRPTPERLDLPHRSIRNRLHPYPRSGKGLRPPARSVPGPCCRRVLNPGRRSRGSARAGGNPWASPHRRQRTTTRSPRWPSSGPAIREGTVRPVATSASPRRPAASSRRCGPHRTHPEMTWRRKPERADHPAVASGSLRVGSPSCRADRRKQEEQDRRKKQKYQNGHVTGTPRPPRVVVTARRTA
jgi:hypothetical protein